MCICSFIMCRILRAEYRPQGVPDGFFTGNWQEVLWILANMDVFVVPELEIKQGTESETFHQPALSGLSFNL